MTDNTILYEMLDNGDLDRTDVLYEYRDELNDAIDIPVPRASPGLLNWWRQMKPVVARELKPEQTEQDPAESESETETEIETE